MKFLRFFGLTLIGIILVIEFSARSVGETPRNPTLKISIRRLPGSKLIKPEEKPTQLQSMFGRWEERKYDFTIKNVSGRKAVIGLWTCSIYDNWKIDGENLSLFPGISACDSNFIVNKIIESGKTLTITHSVFRQVDGKNSHPHFRVILHPSPPELDFRTISVSKAGKYDQEILKEWEIKADDLQKQLLDAWKADPLNRDFVSNEIEF